MMYSCTGAVYVHLQEVMSTISWSLSSLLNTWASVTDPYMDMNSTSWWFL